MSRFATKQALVAFAEQFLRERIRSLENDVRHCLRKPYAPFPAILYCFSTIDLLGAVRAGRARRSGGTTKQAADYMERFMNYRSEQARLLQNIYRHKLVHLAMPKAVVEDNGRLIGFAYSHYGKKGHLKLRKLLHRHHVAVGSPAWTINFDYWFEISISQIVKDIRKSIFGPSGYLDSLQVNSRLRANFQQAIEEIYDPKL